MPNWRNNPNFVWSDENCTAHCKPNKAKHVTKLKIQATIKAIEDTFESSTWRDGVACRQAGEEAERNPMLGVPGTFNYDLDQPPDDDSAAPGQSDQPEWEEDKQSSQSHPDTKEALNQTGREDTGTSLGGDHSYDINARSHHQV